MSIRKNEYQIEVFEETFENDPVWTAEAQAPFQALHVGERFNPGALAAGSWGSLADGQEFRIKDIDHIFYENTETVGHKLMVKLTAVDRTQEF